MSVVKILIVEDDEITARYTEKMLEHLGYSVAGIIPSGEEVLSRLNAIQPDLIIMDITLAGTIDGIATAVQINNSRYNIPIIYLTSNTSAETVERAMEATKSYGYLLKPIKGMDLQINIDTALKRHRFEHCR